MTSWTDAPDAQLEDLQAAPLQRQAEHVQAEVDRLLAVVETGTQQRARRALGHLLEIRGLSEMLAAAGGVCTMGLS